MATDPTKSNILFPGANNTSVYNQAQGQAQPQAGQGAGMPTGDTSQRFTSPGFGTQSWAGKYISHGKDDTRTKATMALEAAKSNGVDLNAPDPGKLREWAAKDPYWYQASQELGMIPNQQQQQSMTQLHGLIGMLSGQGLGKPLYSPQEVQSVYKDTILPYIENMRKDMLGNAQKYGGSGDVKGTTANLANSMAAYEANYPQLQQEMSMINQQSNIGNALNALLGRTSGLATLFGGQQGTTAGVP